MTPERRRDEVAYQVTERHLAPLSVVSSTRPPPWPPNATGTSRRRRRRLCQSRHVSGGAHPRRAATQSSRTTGVFRRANVRGMTRVMWCPRRRARPRAPGPDAPSISGEAQAKPLGSSDFGFASRRKASERDHAAPARRSAFPRGGSRPRAIWARSRGPARAPPWRAPRARRFPVRRSFGFQTSTRRSAERRRRFRRTRGPAATRRSSTRARARASAASTRAASSRGPAGARARRSQPRRRGDGGPVATRQRVRGRQERVRGGTALRSVRAKRGGDFGARDFASAVSAATNASSGAVDVRPRPRARRRSTWSCRVGATSRARRTGHPIRRRPIARDANAADRRYRNIRRPVRPGPLARAAGRGSAPSSEPNRSHAPRRPWRGTRGDDCDTGADVPVTSRNYEHRGAMAKILRERVFGCTYTR